VDSLFNDDDDDRTNSVTSSYCDDDDDDHDDEPIIQEVFLTDFTDANTPLGIAMAGMTVLSSEQDDSCWDVESYANDSIPLTRMRLHVVTDDTETIVDSPPTDLGYGYGETMEDTSSLSGGRRFERPQITDDDDDWSMQSDCNDSVGLANARFQGHRNTHKAVIAAPAFARIDRRRASMGKVTSSSELPSNSSTPRQIRREFRRMSLSSAVTMESTCSSSHGSGDSTDPVGSSGSGGGGKRRGVTRHKSMPYVKMTSTDISNQVPLWPSNKSDETGGRQRMARRNSGAPCAA